MLLPAFVLAATILAFRRKWLYAIGVFLIVILTNVYCELLPIHLVCDDCSKSYKVLVYNVHSLAGEFESHASEIAKAIVDERSGFVFLTEYYETVSDKILDSLKSHYPYVNTTHRWDNNDGDVFFSSWEIDSVCRYSISGSFCSIYRVQIHKFADTLALYCCHLSSNNLKLEEGRWASLQEGRRLRNMEADTLVAALQKERYPVIVMGDMNDVSFSPAVKKIRSAGLNDAWWDGGFGYGSTYHDGWLRLRIDHILYDNQRLKLKNVHVVGEKEWSDHRAVVAGFELKAKGDVFQ